MHLLLYQLDACADVIEQRQGSWRIDIVKLVINVYADSSVVEDGHPSEGRDTVFAGPVVSPRLSTERVTDKC